MRSLGTLRVRCSPKTTGMGGRSLPVRYDFIEEKLYEDNYLNDVRFCKAYVHDKTAYQRWGRLKIRAGLQALQLPNAAIQKAMDELDEKTYFANLHFLSQQHQSYREDQKLRFLLQRGFTYDEIRKYL